MKKKGIIIFVLLIMVISYASAESNKKSDQAILNKIFESSKSDFKTYNTNYSGKVNDNFLNLSQLEELSRTYVTSLKIKEIDREEIEESKMNKLSIYGQGVNGENITLILYSYKGEDGLSESSIFIDASGNEDYKKLEEISSKISKILEKQKIKAENTSCILGTFKGELESEYKMGIVEKIIKNTKSKEVESLVDDSVTSYSLYSKDIENYIYSGKKKVNLNIAIHYNEYEDETYIIIASPIITMGY